MKWKILIWKTKHAYVRVIRSLLIGFNLADSFQVAIFYPD